jgi:DinB superfamily
MDGALAVLMAAVDQAFQRKSWHGPNLRGALRGVTAEQAVWRPAGDRHNIWELALHAAYWKYIVARRLRGRAARGAFPLPGRDFFARPFGPPLGALPHPATTAGLVAGGGPSAAADSPPAISESDWRRELELLVEMHCDMRAAIAALPPAAIDRPSATGSKTSARDLILGAAAHDLYHAGQIQLLKRLQSSPSA